jgi:hypothetical protein
VAIQNSAALCCTLRAPLNRRRELQVITPRSITSSEVHAALRKTGLRRRPQRRRKDFARYLDLKLWTPAHSDLAICELVNKKGNLLPHRLYCARVNGRGRAMRAWMDRTNDGLSGMPADGISLPPKKGGLRHVPLAGSKIRLRQPCGWAEGGMTACSVPTTPLRCDAQYIRSQG